MVKLSTLDVLAMLAFVLWTLLAVQLWPAASTNDQGCLTDYECGLTDNTDGLP